MGNNQVEGEDFHETFAPVVKIDTVHCLLAMAASKGLELHQMDVHNAFLNGDLPEDIYMKPPPDFFPPKLDMVCKLKKSFYGLRQAPRQWYFKLAPCCFDMAFKPLF